MNKAKAMAWVLTASMGLSGALGAGVQAAGTTADAQTNSQAGTAVTYAQAIQALADLEDRTERAKGTPGDGYLGSVVLQWGEEFMQAAGVSADTTISGAQLDDLFGEYAQTQGLDYIHFPTMDNGPTVSSDVLTSRINILETAPEDYDYEDKDLWYKTDLYGGFYSPYQIVLGNGDNTFDMPRFVNSQQGELLMSRIKYELALLGDSNYASEEMINYWASRGVIEKDYNADNHEAEWLTYTPDYMYAEENKGKTYPVVFDYHGGGGTLFESMDHGFVDICYDNEFIVVTPEVSNSNSTLAAETIPVYLDAMEAEGYPIDRSRVYAAGMSMGGIATMVVDAKDHDIVAAGAPHSSAFGLLADTESITNTTGANGRTSTMSGVLTAEEIANADTPFYLELGSADMNQLPLKLELVTALNRWLQAADCPTVAQVTTDNPIGVTADRVYEETHHGTKYVFAEYLNTKGEVTVKLAWVENVPHWTEYDYAQLAWNFMSRYSIVDGVRTCTENPSGSASAGKTTGKAQAAASAAASTVSTAAGDAAAAGSVHDATSDVTNDVTNDASIKAIAANDEDAELLNSSLTQDGAAAAAGAGEDVTAEGYTVQGEGYTSVVSWFREGAYNIYGRWYYPENFDATKKYTTVILNHGANITSDIWNTYYAPQLAANGYVVYSFDCRSGSMTAGQYGRATYSDPTPDGTYSVATYSEDLNAAMDFVEQAPYVDTDHLYLIGQSLGGMTVQNVASQRADEIAGIVVLYGSVSPDEGPELPNIQEVMAHPYSNGEVLFIQGTDDPLVTAERTEENMKWYQWASMVLINQATHGFGYMPDRATQLAAQSMVDFIARTSAPGYQESLIPLMSE